MESASPGLMPFGCTGGFESALKPAVVWKPMTWPPGRLPGDAKGANDTPLRPVTDSAVLPTLVNVKRAWVASGEPRSTRICAAPARQLAALVFVMQSKRGAAPKRSRQPPRAR